MPWIFFQEIEFLSMPTTIRYYKSKLIGNCLYNSTYATEESFVLC